METTEVYPSDLTDAQWAVLAPLIPPPKPGGRPRRLDMRQVVNAIFYIDRTGCQWRYLRKKYPNWKTVYSLLHALAGRRYLGAHHRRAAPPAPSDAGARSRAERGYPRLPVGEDDAKDVLSQPPAQAAVGSGDLERLRCCTASS